MSCSIQGSNCYFLTCIQVSQEIGKIAWYSHLSKSFPQFATIHTVQGFSTMKQRLMFFWNSLAFSMIQRTVGNLMHKLICSNSTSRLYNQQKQMCMYTKGLTQVNFQQQNLITRRKNGELHYHSCRS